MDTKLERMYKDGVLSAWMIQLYNDNDEQYYENLDGCTSILMREYFKIK